MYTGRVNVLLLIVASVVSAGASKWGPGNVFDCHCSLPCDAQTGHCPGACDPGCYGPTCQIYNVALHKRTIADIVSHPTPYSAMAVDGDRMQAADASRCFYAGTSTIILDSTTPKVFLAVDLGKPYRLNQMKLYNKDGNIDAKGNAYISVQNSSDGIYLLTPDTSCATFNAEIVRNVVDLNCHAMGRWVVLFKPAIFTETFPLLEICELEVYVCTEGHYGDDCTGNCFCQGQPCDPRDGRCHGPCMPGYHGDTCSEVCPASHFGQDCIKQCHCADGECDRVTGKCDSHCQVGWQGESCSEPCRNGSFGENCTGSCHCRERVCDHVTGKCQGACAAGWTGEKCNEVCEFGHFGAGCRQTCHCSMGTCDHVSGICETTCMPGWRGDNCDQGCPNGRFGDDCKHQCHCLQQPCSPDSGLCLPGGCLLGWTGSNCTMPTENLNESTFLSPNKWLIGSAMAGALVAVCIIILVYSQCKRPPRRNAPAGVDNLGLELKTVECTGTPAAQRQNTGVQNPLFSH